MNRISRNERTPIFFNSILSGKKMNLNGFKLHNTFNNKYNNKKQFDMKFYRENLIIFQNLQKIR
jgi:hypothetical protein